MELCIYTRRKNVVITCVSIKNGFILKGYFLVVQGVQKFKERSVNFLNLLAKFCKILKIRGYVATKTKEVNFFISLANFL